MARRRTTRAQDERSRGDRAMVEIIVVDLAEKAVTTAAVALTPPTKGARIALKFDRSRQLYRGSAPPGRYTASVASRGIERQERRIDVTQGGTEETFIVGRPGLPFYYRGRRRGQPSMRRPPPETAENNRSSAN